MKDSPELKIAGDYNGNGRSINSYRIAGAYVGRQCANSVSCLPKIENIRLENCKYDDATFHSAVFENIAIKNLGIRGELQVRGCLLRNVVIAGSVGKISFSSLSFCDGLPNTNLRDSLREHYQSMMSAGEVALDVSAGDFSNIDITGIPPDCLVLDWNHSVRINRAAFEAEEKNANRDPLVNSVISALSDVCKGDEWDIVLVEPSALRRGRKPSIVQEATLRTVKHFSRLGPEVVKGTWRSMS